MQESNAVANANKFTPKPGDKIICNNGKEFICCTLGFLHDHDIRPIRAKTILGFNPTEKVWQDWDKYGRASDYNDNDQYNIQEVIPQNVGAADKKEEVKEESLHTMQEIKEAWDASGWFSSNMSWNTFKKNLTKINSPEYKLYLELKAKFEGKE